MIPGILSLVTIIGVQQIGADLKLLLQFQKKKFVKLINEKL